MSRNRPRAAAERPLCLEVLEPRAMMAAQSVYDFQLDPIEFANDAQQTSILDNSYTGLANARTDYGFDGHGQTVAVIDSGIAYNHYALGGGFGANYRVVGGWDFAENDANPWDDTSGHGTHVAGIVGSTDSQGSGVAPGVDLVALRVFDDSGAGSFSWVEQALQWVHQHRNDFASPITAVNLSIGTTWNANTPPAWAMLGEEFAQLEADGIFIAVAAGNSFASYNVPGVSYPAASSHVVPVAAVDGNGNLAGFSQRNDRSIATPGVSILSTVPDYQGNGNGVADDFGYKSGTSMASPYMAGASTLLRQAMQFAGFTNITETSMYSIMRNTADIIHDSATNADYHRLNIQHSIDYVMGPDDFGSTAGAAYSLGSISTTANRTGVLTGKLSDQDYFSFTAGQSGSMTFTVAAEDQMVAHWQLSGLQATTGNNGQSFTMQVAAGQSYTFGISSDAGLGHYTLSADLQASTQNLGTVEFLQLNDQHLTSGENWYALTAKRSGKLSVEALFAHAGGNVDLEIYDANNNLLASSATANDGERLDLNVTAGATYYVRTVGINADVDFRIANLLQQSGSLLTVFGTTGNDTFVMTAGATHQVTINGVSYSIDGSSVTNVVFNGGAGADTAQFNLTAGNETVTLKPGTADIVGAGYQAHATGVESFTVNGGGGYDIVSLYGTAGNDTFVGGATTSTFTTAGLAATVNNFSVTNAYAGKGGTDVASFYDSAGNDAFTARTTYSVMQGTAFYNYAQGFAQAYAYGGAGGTDIAYLYDSKGDDTFNARPTWSTLQGKGFFYQAALFSQVYAYSSGGRDKAYMYGSAGDDTFVLQKDYAALYGDGFYLQCQGFKNVYVYDSAGYDTAILYDSKGNDVLTAKKGFVGLKYANVAAEMNRGFDKVQAYGTAGGRNTKQIAALDFILERYGKW